MGLLTRDQKIKLLQGIAAGKESIESLIPYKPMKVIMWNKPVGSDMIINSETGESRPYKQESENAESKPFNSRIDRLNVIVINSGTPLRTRETDVIEAMENAGEINKHYTPTI